MAILPYEGNRGLLFKRKLIQCKLFKHARVVALQTEPSVHSNHPKDKHLNIYYSKYSSKKPS